MTQAYPQFEGHEPAGPPEGAPAEPGWEARASSWVRRGVLALALAVAGSWMAASLAPALTAPGAILGVAAAHAHKKKRSEGLDCSDLEDCADCIDCIDCIDCVDCADCGGLDCGGCADCGGLDCGGLDCACTVATPARASVGASCRRGASWRSALVALIPLLVFAAWRRLPERGTRRQG